MADKQRLRYPNDLNPEQNPKQNAILILAYQSDPIERVKGAKEKTKASEQLNAIGGVLLPLPNSLAEEQAHSWTEWGAEDMIADTVNIATTGAAVLGAKAKQATDAGLAVTGAIVDAARAVGKVAGRTAGMKLDPRTRLEYTGEGTPRTIELSYTFMPKDSKEAKTILEIIQFFRVTGTGRRTDVAPTENNSKLLDMLAGAANAVSNAFVQEPCRFLLEFQNNDPLNTIMGFNKPFVLESTSSNLFEDGYPALFHDNMPKKITVNFSFKETEIQYADDWNKKVVNGKSEQWTAI